MADGDSAAKGRLWLDLAEEAIFEELQNCSSLGRYNGLNRKVDAIQAAYFTCLVQNWEGNDAAKSRIRHQRLTAVVAVLTIRPLFR